jgi:hypothetical protein
MSHLLLLVSAVAAALPAAGGIRCSAAVAAGCKDVLPMHTGLGLSNVYGMRQRVEPLSADDANLNINADCR